MISPIQGEFVITQEFGEEKTQYGPHTGMDIAPRSDEAYIVLAPADGVVEAAGFGNMEGNFIVIKHEPGIIHQQYGYQTVPIFTKFYHLDEKYVETGAEIKQGDPIGVVGGTGSASQGIHLHFEIREGSRYGDAVNPRNYILFGDTPQYNMV
jgi:murein DD-endopeptidase MepM/ murein hydrolase activator NlpD